MSEEKNGFSEQEEKVLEFWKKEQIFEKSLEKTKDGPKFTFYDGPPFATGLPHYGHILSSVAKDLVPRYKTMRGFYVRRRWGWDCHGLPIETLVEKKLNISGKKQIEEIGIDKFNETARGMVLDYISHWKEMVDRVGRWVEFEDSYKTMDTTFMESVWWSLKQIWDKGMIYEGKKVLLYCTRCETPVSKAETEMDGGYQDVTGDSITVKFKIIKRDSSTSFDPAQDRSFGMTAGEGRDSGSGSGMTLPENTYILAWTTTPWTLPGNVALAIGDNIEYVLVKDGDEHFVIGKPLLERYQEKNWEVVRSISSSDLLGLKYEPLFEVKAFENNENVHKVVAGDFVTTEDGTGVVHIAVMYGEDDFKVGQKENLPFVQLLASNGNYNEEAPELIRGKHYLEAQEEIMDSLESRGLLVKKEEFSHSYPFCWRCGSPLIYNALSAWFIDIQSIKERLIQLNENISWYPGFLKEGRFLYILQTAPDWNISRNRFWATALPFWKCDKCGKSVCFGSVEQLREKAKNFEEVYGDKPLAEIDLHRPYIDKVVVACECGEQMYRIPEVIDCWVESSSMPFAELHYPFENEALFKERFPAQFIAEYIGQTRAWFYYLHVLATVLFDNVSFENAVVTGTILAEDGSKMSKSKGNFPDPMKMIDTYGADALRFYLMSSVVMQADNLFFSERDMREVYNKVINIVHNVRNYYQMYAQGAGSDFTLENKLDEWIISELNKFMKGSTESLDAYNTVSYCRGIRDFADILSTWWLRRSRDRFKKDDEDSKNAKAVLGHVLRNFALVVAPVLPYTSESVWQAVKNDKDAQSVHLAGWPSYDESLIKNDLEANMRSLREVVEIGHALRAETGMRVRQPLARVAVSRDQKDLSFEDGLGEILLEELNIKKLEKRDALTGEGISEKELKGIKVAIDTVLTEDLRKEGIAREIVRHIQDLRKNSGCKPGEKISIEYSAEGDLKDIFEEVKTVLEKETNSDIALGEGDQWQKEVKMNGNVIKFRLNK